jgi:hypothetical protein
MDDNHTLLQESHSYARLILIGMSLILVGMALLLVCRMQYYLKLIFTAREILRRVINNTYFLYVHNYLKITVQA